MKVYTAHNTGDTFIQDEGYKPAEDLLGVYSTLAQAKQACADEWEVSIDEEPEWNETLKDGDLVSCCADSDEFHALVCAIEIDSVPRSL